MCCQIFQMVFFPDSTESNLLCCCNRSPVLSQIFQMGFLPDSSVLSQILQMVFFLDSMLL
jgi:hypothetical protein